MKLQIVDVFNVILMPAAFGRLCVETKRSRALVFLWVPAAFGRLCVETVNARIKFRPSLPSRLRAAVC